MEISPRIRGSLFLAEDERCRSGPAFHQGHQMARTHLLFWNVGGGVVGVRGGAQDAPRPRVEATIERAA